MLPSGAVVIDTNVWISAALTPDGTCAAAIRKAAEGYDIIHSTETMAELDRKLGAKFSKMIPLVRRTEFMQTVKKLCTEIEMTHEVFASRDPDDNKFLGVALSGAADQLISSDPDLTNLKYYQGVQIWTPAAFVQREIAARQAQAEHRKSNK